MVCAYSMPDREKKVDELLAKILASKGLSLDDIQKKEDVDEEAIKPENLFKKEDVDEGALQPEALFKKSLGGPISAQETRSVKAFHINMCFYCDNNCIMAMGARSVADVERYYDGIASIVQSQLNTLDSSKWSFTTKALFKLRPGVSIPYLYFKRRSDTSTGFVLLSNVNENFWNFNNLFAFSVSKGCDADFLTIAPGDDIWKSNYVSDVDGIANMMAVCTPHSFSTVKLNPSVEGMAVLVGHELGHLLGMFHDGESEDYSEAQCQYYENNIDASLGPACRKVAEVCTAGDHGCPDGQGNCIMSAAVGRETKFSACSKAYFDIYEQTAAVIRDPNSYDLTCIEAGGKKRALTEDKRVDGDHLPFDLDAALAQLAGNTGGRKRAMP